MANYNTDLKDWGSSGEEFPDGYSYAEGEQPVDAWDNFITSNIISDVKDHLVPLTNSRIESDYGSDGNRPSSPEHPHAYYNTDDERIEHWDDGDQAWYTHLRRDGDTMAGVLDMGGYKIHDGTGTLTLDGVVNAPGTLNYGGNEVATQTWVNNESSVPNADTVRGFAVVDSDGNTVRAETYATTGDVPTLPKGSIAYVDGDGLYIEDGN